MFQQKRNYFWRFLTFGKLKHKINYHDLIIFLLSLYRVFFGLFFFPLGKKKEKRKKEEKKLCFQLEPALCACKVKGGSLEGKSYTFSNLCIFICSAC